MLRIGASWVWILSKMRSSSGLGGSLFSNQSHPSIQLARLLFIEYELMIWNQLGKAIFQLRYVHRRSNVGGEPRWSIDSFSIPILILIVSLLLFIIFVEVVNWLFILHHFHPLDLFALVVLSLTTGSESFLTSELPPLSNFAFLSRIWSKSRWVSDLISLVNLLLWHGSRRWRDWRCVRLIVESYSHFGHLDLRFETVFARWHEINENLPSQVYSGLTSLDDLRLNLIYFPISILLLQISLDFSTWPQ